MTRVLLFRDHDESDKDRYVTALSSAGLDATCVPVMKFVTIGESELLEHLTRPHDFAGVIITSKRGSAAFSSALTHSGLSRDWKEIKVYAVGMETARPLLELGLHILGTDCGSGAALAELVVRQHQDSRLPLLYLCGQRHREELPAILKEKNVPFVTLEVYKATPVTTLDAPPEEPDWLVFFSPAGVQTVKELCPSAWSRAKKAAIGATTAKGMVEAGWSVDAVAGTPTPAGLVEALIGGH